MNGIPLWTDDNDTLSSSYFEIPEGKVGIIFGVNFAEEIVRDTGAFITEQAACVHKVYLTVNNLPQEVGCGGVLDFDKFDVQPYVDEEVLTCDGPWQLTKCHNIGIIGVPGTYQLKLNGRASDDRKPQVYLELYDIEDIVPQVTGLFYN